MPRERGRDRTKGSVASSRGGGRDRPKRNPSPNDPVTDIYKEMLSEAALSTATASGGEGRPLKKRKLGRPYNTSDSRVAIQPERPAPMAVTGQGRSTHTDNESGTDHHAGATQQQITTDESEISDESDVEWEEVGIEGNAEIQQAGSGIRDLSIVINPDQGSTTKPVRVRRRKTAVEDKKIRIDVHKVHILCLLIHIHIRNVWCKDKETHAILKQLLTSRMISYLNPNPDFSQFQQSRSFMDGLSQVSDMWKMKYKIIALGMRRPLWAAINKDLANLKLPEDTDPPMSRSDFQQAASKLEGSSDVGAQLLCALLRSAGVEARLVCSLQVLGFAAGASGPQLQVPKAEEKTVYAGSSADERGNTRDESLTKRSAPPPPLSGMTPGPARIRRIGRIGQASFGSSALLDPGRAPVLEASKRKRIYHPTYPVFWVEAFNVAHQKWVPIDPLCTGTVGKPSRLEPPLNDPANGMSYVIAFEEDGTAKDVTRRYARAYNAKTRKTRVENTEGGERWWRKAMKMFRRRNILDRDQVEDAELSKKEAAEEMPRNVQDFKDHPYYVLERHLKQNQITYPKREVGSVNAGTSASTKLEPIYRRRDVHMVRSADKWYRFGREVKAGEQPLKHANPRRRRGRSVDPDADAEDGTGNGLYAIFQTELYVPPPVIRGRVPRNAHGNLDVYVPSMVPAGGVHIRSPDAAKAARLIGIDYADAVTGFKFQGRQGTAVTEGVVIAAEYQEAVEAVIAGFRYAREQAEDRKRTVEALRLWKRFLVGLRIVERVRGYAEEDEEKDVRDEIDREVEDQGGGGGFFAEDGEGVVMPTAGRTQHEDWFGGRFLPSEIDKDPRMPWQSDPEDQDDSWRTPPVRRRRIIVDEPTEAAKDSSDINLDGAEPVINSDDPAVAEGGGFLPEGLGEDVVQELGEGHVRRTTPPEEEGNGAGTTPTAAVIEVEGDNPSNLQMSDNDRGSLLSHDPEDEDAEPEWLEAVDSDE